MEGQPFDQRSFKNAWGNIDGMDDPLAFVQYMDEIRPPEVDLLQAYQPAVDLLQVAEGAHVLEVGCGTGGAARALAGLVGSSGRVVGVDYSTTMITAALQRSDGLGLPLEYYVADAHALPYADASFSQCYSGSVFEVLAHPEQALREMIRVARPGAHVVISATDILLIDADDRALTRRIVNFVSDHEYNGWLGRQLPRLYKENGLIDVVVLPNSWIITDYAMFYRKWLGMFLTHAQEAEVITPHEVSVWSQALEQRAKADTFFVAWPHFWVSGRKP